MFMKVQKGFTLIELMVTVAIIAILASIAVPSYNDYVTKGKIPEATSELSSRRIQAEQYFQDNRTYATSGAFINPACVALTSGKNFDFSCTAQTANTYTVQALGKSTMAGFTYTINELGARTSTVTKSGWTGNATCWAISKDGSC
jgi:type IV pilus assembly protein PilE